jgi:uncharacterized membrane protein YfcA
MFGMNSFKTSRNFTPENSERLYFIIIVINTLFGLQFLNSFFSMLVNFLRERQTVSLLQVAIYAIVTFVLVFFGGFLFKKLSKRMLLVVLVVAISIVRYIVQICRWAPLSYYSVDSKPGVFHIYCTAKENKAVFYFFPGHTFRFCN